MKKKTAVLLFLILAAIWFGAALAALVSSMEAQLMDVQFRSNATKRHQSLMERMHNEIRFIEGEGR